MSVKFVRCLSSSSLVPTRALDLLRHRKLLDKCTKVDVSTRHVEGSSVYVGFDPTADSLHIGNLVAVIAMLHFQQAGYQPLAVVGGATGIIGDPSGRSTERKPLSLQTLEYNVAGIQATLTKIFGNASNLLPVRQSSPPLLEVLNNADWYRNMSVVGFMSDIGRQFRISSMLRKESIQQRMDSLEGLSYTEFSYQIFQAYDFLHLHQTHNCCMQIGGGDQWGNITAGCEFVRKSTGAEVHGVTVPLVTTSSGEKIGKSAGNAVWLSAEKTSPYHLYQYFVRTADQDVARFLHYFTFTSTEEISTMMEAHLSAPEKFLAQRHLAEQVTKLVHGEGGLQEAMEASAALFGDNDALYRLSEEALERVFKGAPTSELSRDQWSSDTSITDLLTATGAVQSKGMARRLVSGGGVYINHARVHSDRESFKPEQHVLHGKLTILRTGKKNYHLIKWI